ncbi:T9SS type A sorting domain-containing protein [Flavobacterium nackdongense]|uniref:T9SS type A sorting domain-containing protein n=1 Tax=Flavobacterium nackdongense TaxID=2547394 RepID=A0A4P6YD85_9FLAO|nr:T9SS type A sorting domain-containing protein [Flavobacterium nackdongense]QBN18323.1 T9SS type A sorting domain-containing protein [Flavobacterium nackdongense]
MKKITLLLFCLLHFSGFSQSKSASIVLTSGLTAQFTLNSNTNKVTLVLKGPSDRWFAIGLGVQSGFGMADGDVLVYTTSLSDRNYVGTGAPATDASQDWTVISNPTPVGGVRTLTLERALTNSDANDFQLPYATTNTIDLAWARSASASTSLANHGTGNRGFASATFTTLGVEDFSLNATSVYPNPASGEFFIKAKTKLSKINLYSQLGALVKTVPVADDAREVQVEVNGIQKGVYFLELQNEKEKSWKKIILE